MLSALIAGALLAQIEQPVNVIELPDDNAKNIRVAVSVAAPYDLTDREQAAWRILPMLVLQGTREYSRQSIYDVSLSGGQIPRAIGGPDFIRIELAAAPGNADVAADVLENILTKPRFREEDFEAARRDLKQEKNDPVAELLDPARPTYDRATLALCERLWQQACQPGRISVVVAGRFSVGEPKKAFEGRFEVERPPSRGNTRFDKPAGEIKYHLRPLTSFELAADPISFTDPSAGARLLAVHALGAGKDSTLYRVLREKAGLSYEQRAILWPTAKGWVPRLYVIRRAEEGDSAILQRVISLLEADVEAWTQADLDRAKAMSSAALNGHPVDNLFWVDESGPMTDILERDNVLRAFLAMAGAPDWTRDRLKLEMNQVNLERLKAAGTEIVKTAKSRVIPGLP